MVEVEKTHPKVDYGKLSVKSRVTEACQEGPRIVMLRPFEKFNQLRPVNREGVDPLGKKAFKCLLFVFAITKGFVYNHKKDKCLDTFLERKGEKTHTEVIEG